MMLTPAMMDMFSAGVVLDDRPVTVSAEGELADIGAIRKLCEDLKSCCEPQLASLQALSNALSNVKAPQAEEGAEACEEAGLSSMLKDIATPIANDVLDDPNKLAIMNTILSCFAALAAFGGQDQICDAGYDLVLAGIYSKDASVRVQAMKAIELLVMSTRATWLIKKTSFKVGDSIDLVTAMAKIEELSMQEDEEELAEYATKALAHIHKHEWNAELTLPDLGCITRAWSWIWNQLAMFWGLLPAISTLIGLKTFPAAKIRDDSSTSTATRPKEAAAAASTMPPSELDTGMAMAGLAEKTTGKGKHNAYTHIGDKDAKDNEDLNREDEPEGSEQNVVSAALADVNDVIADVNGINPKPPTPHGTPKKKK